MRGELRIDLSAIRDNFRLIDQKTGQACVVAPAVKADCYGLGMAKIAPTLYEAGARRFFVAIPEEGAALRKLLPEAQIFALHGFSKKQSKLYETNHIVPVLNSVAEISNYRKFAVKSEKKLPCIFHFDTGMNRLGIPAEERARVSENLDGLEVLYVMSHFACSDERGNAFNALQAQRFSEIAAMFPQAKRSLANSGGIFLNSAYHHDMVRPGLAIYGGNPVAGEKNPMNPVVSLHLPLLQVHHAGKGETAGYGQTYTFDDDTKVAVVSAGYADGLMRSLSNRGALYWKGHRLPIRGRVSMDLIICDLAGVPERDYPKPGDYLEMIGPHQSIDDLARDSGTIGYEILTSLGSRYRRVYI